MVIGTDHLERLGKASSTSAHAEKLKEVRHVPPP